MAVADRKAASCPLRPCTQPIFIISMFNSLAIWNDEKFNTFSLKMIYRMVNSISIVSWFLIDNQLSISCT